MTKVHIQYHVLIIRASFIGRAPSTLKKLKLSIFNKCFYLIFLFLGLFVIPKRKEFHFSIRELSPGVLKQFLNCSRYNLVDSASVIQANEILINCVNPSNVIMAMWNQVNSKMLSLVRPCHYWVYWFVYSAMSVLLFFIAF